jgi:hypothetical protein
MKSDGRMRNDRLKSNSGAAPPMPPAFASPQVRRSILAKLSHRIHQEGLDNSGKKLKELGRLQRIDFG